MSSNEQPLRRRAERGRGAVLLHY